MLRPRLVWGPDDVTVLPGFVEAVENGRFSWVGGGTHLTSTSHIDNVVHGLRLAAEKGRPGEAYFVTDGEPLVFRDFITRLLATRGVTPPDRNLPVPLARVAATASEALWRLLPLPGDPPITRLAYFLTANEVTIDISKARSELGYEPLIERRPRSQRARRGGGLSPPPRELPRGHPRTGRRIRRRRHQRGDRIRHADHLPGPARGRLPAGRRQRLQQPRAGPGSGELRLRLPARAHRQPRRACGASHR